VASLGSRAEVVFLEMENGLFPPDRSVNSPVATLRGVGTIASPKC